MPGTPSLAAYYRTNLKLINRRLDGVNKAIGRLQGDQQVLLAAREEALDYLARHEKEKRASQPQLPFEEAQEAQAAEAQTA